MAKKTDNDELAKEQTKRFEDGMSKYQSVFATDHQDIAQYFLPQDSDITTQKTEGVTGWTDQIFDTTAILAAETLKSGQYNWLTPPNQPWAEFDVPEELKAGKEDDDEGLDEATRWLGKASDIALRELARSNFYSVVANSYLGVGVFGTDAMICEDDKEGDGINFRHIKIGTYVIEENYKGIVDTLRRKFKLTYRQAKQEFGEDNLPEDMKRAASGANGAAKKFEFLHCIFPREDSDRLPNRADGPNKPIASVHISVEFKKCVKISGYEENPILCSRFDKWGTDSPWGYGPAYLVLPEARQCNYVQQYLDAAAELHVDPRVLIPDNLEGDVDLRAGGTTTFDSGNPDGVPREWATVSEYKLGMEMQEQRRQAIREAFFVPAFKLLNSQPLLDKKMTAYELSQRQAENLSGFTPQFGRRVPEFLNPLMLLVFGKLFRQRKFGKAPDSLMKDLGNGKKGLVAPQIVITSRISDALKALKNRGIEETFQFIMPQVEAGRPEALDVFDMDGVNREYARNTGMPPDLIRPTKGKGSVEAIRAARAQAMAQQRQAQQLELLTKSAKNLGGAPQAMQDRLTEAA